MQLRVVTANQAGILVKVAQTFTTLGINLSGADCRTGNDGRVTNLFSFVCRDLKELKKVMKVLERVKGVVTVERA